MGVGVFTAIAVLRILFHISLAKMLTVFYVLLFLLSFFAPSEFIAVAFDPDGVTTGPMTVPFIMALGVGLSAARSDKDGANDSFGFVALCSVGPILMVLLLGIFYHPTDAVYTAVEVTPVADHLRRGPCNFCWPSPSMPMRCWSACLPVVGVFVICSSCSPATTASGRCLRMSVGFLYTYVGLVLFLHRGQRRLCARWAACWAAAWQRGTFKWLLVPIGIVIGYYIVKAEPAVQVLNEQVEDLTGGTVSRGMMNAALSIGVACAVALAMVRVLTGFNIYWIIIPGYISGTGPQPLCAAGLCRHRL